MSDDIYGHAYDAFIDEIYQNGGGEPSAVRAAVDCAIKSLRAELAAERDNNKSLNKHLTRARGNTQTMKVERDELRELLREAREDPDYRSLKGGLRARIDAALKGDGDE